MGILKCQPQRKRHHGCIMEVFDSFCHKFVFYNKNFNEVHISFQILLFFNQSLLQFLYLICTIHIINIAFEQQVRSDQWVSLIINLEGSVAEAV
jgi:hypothetical protein